MNIRNLKSAHFGNGLTVYDTNNEKNGDFEIVAHIDYNRNVTYYKNVILSQEDKKIIETIASNNVRSISTTQDQLVLKPLK